ncbi:MAG TPA: ABC transporter permease [Anaerolineae bacterium]|nr:ABC transporter permease [Anaerolineae bacterium]
MQGLALSWMRFRIRLGNVPEAVALISFLAVFLFFAVAAPNFLSSLALADILTFGSIMGIIVIGVATLMIAGEFDLSVGSNFAVASYVWAILMNAGVSPVAAMILAVLSSVFLGAVNGLVVIWSGLPSFIVTLGTMLAYRGIARGIGGSDFAKFTGEPPFLFDLLNGPMTSINALFAQGTSLRISIIWFILIAIVMSWVLNRTRFGNWLFATGGNAGAALEQGVPVKRVKLGAFMLVGLLVGLASMMQFAHRTSIDPVRGEGWELVAVSASVIGGVSLLGGSGTIVGAALGMLLLMTLDQGLVLMGVSVQVFRAVAGGILILAAILNAYLGRES